MYLSWKLTVIINNMCQGEVGRGNPLEVEAHQTTEQMILIETSIAPPNVDLLKLLMGYSKL